MSAAVTQAPVRVFTNTRRVPRFPLAVPADVTVLRSGIPHSIPGRSVTIGERGLGVVVAGELHPGDSVGIEFRLPDTGGPFRLKAIVRYQALLHCGLEFVSLTSEQQTLIEHWTRKKSGGNAPASLPVADSGLVAPPPAALTVRKSASLRFRRVTWGALAGMLLLGGLGWWHWRQAWGELESQLPASSPVSQQPPAFVPAEVMQSLLTHKIEPIYPEAARQANVQGVVIIEALVGTDGTVVDVRAISGPDELTLAALDAVKWWRFQPYLVNGQPAQVKTRLAVDFRAN
jgi:TonB family protein